MSKSELDQEWKRIQEMLRDQSFAVFPSTVRQSEQARVAYWPEDEGVEGFINLAKRLGITLIYANKQKFSDEDLEEFKAGLVDEDNNSLYAETVELIESAQAHLNSIKHIWLDWVYDGIVHRYFKEAKWYSDFDERFQEITESSKDDEGELSIEEREKLRAQQSEEWQKKWESRDKLADELAEKLAAIEVFQKANSYEQQRNIARPMFPDLDSWQEDEKPSLRTVVSKARTIYQTRILPIKEKEIALRAHQLIRSGKSKVETASRLGMGEKKLNRLLFTYPEE